MIRLKPITKENYRGCIELKTTKEQEKFFAPNWYSLLEAVYEEARQAFAIYHQEEMIQAKELRISSVKENTIAKQMYEGFGFVATGEFVNDETVLLKEWR